MEKFSDSNMEELNNFIKMNLKEQLQQMKREMYVMLEEVKGMRNSA